LKEIFFCEQPGLFKDKMLKWVESFGIFCFLNSNSFKDSYTKFDFLLAAGSSKKYSFKQGDFELLNSVVSTNKWLFGHFTFEFLHPVLGLPSTCADGTGFDAGFLFEPEIIIQAQGKSVTIISKKSPPRSIYNDIQHVELSLNIDNCTSTLISEFESSGQYQEKLKKLLHHIQRGDCYEINYCIHFEGRQSSQIHPLSLYKKLNSLSPAPMSAFYRVESSYLFCASPERFMTKCGDTLVSQPIKGTIQRQIHDLNTDSKLKKELLQSKKDRAENVMIVDLVRNDMSKVCLPGSVIVSELFGIKSFAQVHHLVSTIKGMIQPNISFASILRALFPMGSMTGAPKKRVMELIRQYETSPRGIFSGTIGYIDPHHDFDWNVVIRSIQFEKESGQIIYKAGSGITALSDPQTEYKECMIKAAAMKNVLHSS
jgi:para-aminobenzoate synthetase component 1